MLHRGNPFGNQAYKRQVTAWKPLQHLPQVIGPVSFNTWGALGVYEIRMWPSMSRGKRDQDVVERPYYITTYVTICLGCPAPLR